MSLNNFHPNWNKITIAIIMIGVMISTHLICIITLNLQSYKDSYCITNGKQRLRDDGLSVNMATSSSHPRMHMPFLPPSIKSMSPSVQSQLTCGFLQQQNKWK